MILRTILSISLVAALCCQSFSQNAHLQVRGQLLEWHDNEDHRAIIEFYRSELAEKENAQFDFFYARALHNVGQNKEAREVLLELEQDSIFSTRAIRLLVNVSGRLGEKTEVLKYLVRLTQIFPENPVFFQRLGMFFMDEGTFSAANNYFSKAKALDPENEIILIQFAHCLFAQENYRAAAGELRRAIEKFPENKEMRKLLVNTLFKMRNHKEVINHARTLVEMSDTTDYVIKFKAISLLNEKDYERAEFWIDYLLDGEDLTEDLFYHKGMILEATGRKEEALEYFEEALHHTRSPNFDHYILKLSSSLTENQKYDKSLAWLQVARQFDNRSPRILYYLARNYDLYYKDKQPAIDTYQLFLQRAGGRFQDYQNFANQRITRLREEQFFKGN